MATSESPSAKIRHQMRKESEEDRLYQRSKTVNRLRKNLRETEEDLKSQNVFTLEELAAVTAKIKHASQTSLLDLRTLKQALFNPMNAVHFLKITGSLQALVGHLTGRKALHQLEAAYICCNLATANEHSCDAVANSAGPYLIQYLDCQNISLQVACLWTLGNLSSGSSKSFGILQAQGLSNCLINCLRNPHSEVIEAAVYALCLMLKSCEFSSDQRKEIASLAVGLKCCKEDVDWLLYLLSCNSDCDQIFLENLIPQRCIITLAGLARDAPINLDTLSALRSVTALVRTSANLCSEESGKAALMILAHDSFPNIFNNLLQASHPHLREEAQWLGLTLLRHSSPEISQKTCILGLDKLMNANDHPC
ncbi:transmembrane and coiled-coil domain-containing protein 6 [Thrips palmi]|uniref:Transmembrane and coiled-coil domain-containing protein 6 n=1 Tax=Thrips palmi TaxID=161013 RepID=A0A6P9A376_THRPL|nr:transmembrane and coiled-coil domain-containing protein 6 [Thrips palmi]